MSIATQLARATGADVAYHVKIDGIPWAFCDQKIGRSFGMRHPIDSTCIACWRMDADSADDEPDATGNGHTMADSGAPASVAGKFSTARDVAYRGAYDYFVASAHADLRPTSVTVAGWIYTENVYQNWQVARIIANRQTGSAIHDGPWVLETSRASSTWNFLTAEVIRDDGSPNGTGDTIGSKTVSALSIGWHHVALTYDATSGVFCLYLDGDQVATTTFSSNKSLFYAGTQHGVYISSTLDSIDGYQDDCAVYSEAKSAAWVRWVAQGALPCFLPPDEEMSLGLDLTTMKVDASNMAFRFLDIRDPSDSSSTRRSYFGKITAPARGSSSSCHTAILRRLDYDDEQLDADAGGDGTGIIYVQDNSNWPTAGVGYLGAEAFSYTGKGTPAQTNFPGGGQTIASFTGVTKGIYPALRTANRGHTYPYPKDIEDMDGDVSHQMMATSEPASLIGREIGMYVSVKEPTTGVWSDPALTWAGQVVSDIEYDPASNTWVLGAESILRLLDRKVARDLPTAIINQVNLNGTFGRKFTVEEEWYNDTDGYWYYMATCTAEVTAGYWGVGDVKAKIIDELADPANWDDGFGSHDDEVYTYSFNEGEDGTLTLAILTGENSVGVTIVSPKTRWTIHPYEVGDGPPRPCHAWQALGFPADKPVEIVFEQYDTSGASEYCEAYWQASRKPYETYHPTDPYYNGGKMQVLKDGNSALWDTQGGWSSIAWIKAEVEEPYSGASSHPVYVDAYSAITDAGPYLELTIQAVPVTVLQEGASLTTVHQAEGFIGCHGMFSRRLVHQVLVPFYDANDGIGPLQGLLYNLLSSGTTDYNDSTWDKCKDAISVDFPVELVDLPSVATHDALILASWADLAARPYYLIDKSVNWSELWQREAMLFGVALCWDDTVGKLVCKSIVEPDWHASEVTIDGSNRLDVDTYPAVKQSVSKIVNHWTIKANHTLGENKASFEQTITDHESYQTIRELREATLEHPGLRPINDEGSIQLTSQLTALFLKRTALFRSPHQEVTVRLAPKLRGLVAIGDIVSYTSAHAHPDPVGSGRMAVTALPALVLNYAWSPARSEGTATLLLFASEHVPAPWGVAAVVDQSATNGGWDAANTRLTMDTLTYGESGDSDDAAAFSAGDFVLVVEGAAEDPTTANFDIYGPFEVDVAYENEGANLLTLVAGTAMAGWDSDKEHRVICADYDSCTAAQQAVNLYQAGVADHFLGGDDDDPDYYG